MKTARYVSLILFTLALIASMNHANAQTVSTPFVSSGPLYSGSLVATYSVDPQSTDSYADWYANGVLVESEGIYQSSGEIVYTSGAAGNIYVIVYETVNGNLNSTTSGTYDNWPGVPASTPLALTVLFLLLIVIAVRYFPRKRVVGLHLQPSVL
jgi:hypothetical protein